MQPPGNSQRRQTSGASFEAKKTGSTPNCFSFILPMLVLEMSPRIARERLVLAAPVVFLLLVCSIARLLVTQHRLELAPDALGRETSQDGLTECGTGRRCSRSCKPESVVPSATRRRSLWPPWTTLRPPPTAEGTLRVNVVLRMGRAQANRQP